MRRDDPSWPQPSSAAATAIMKANRGSGTRPEVIVRSLLHRDVLRFRTTLSIILGDRRWTRPDVVFTRARVAVFIDGCFWHGCPQHRTYPRNNAEYWRAKVERNIARDVDTNDRLRQLGWTVVRAWEHEDPRMVARQIAAVVRGAVRR